jgi:hypothetical protein
MKKYIIKFLLFYFTIVNFSFSKEISNISILIEEDFETAIFVYRNRSSQTTGEILDYNNFEFLGKTYKNEASYTVTFIQPAHLKVSGDRLSYQRKEYKIKKFDYDYNITRSGLSLLSFNVPAEMNNYINQNIPFTISTLSKTAWYAGTFTLVQNDDDLRVILKKNPDTFYKIILHTKVINKTIREFEKSELSQLGINC